VKKGLNTRSLSSKEIGSPVLKTSMMIRC
jgi:hypothetical protein